MKTIITLLLLTSIAWQAQSQNVGIGTTSPSPDAMATIETLGDGATALKLRNPSSSVQFDMFLGGAINGNTFSMGTPGNMPIAMYTNSANRVFVTGGGNVGIGTDNPSINAMVTISTQSDGATALQMRNPGSSVQFDMFLGGAINGNTFSMGTPGNMPIALYTNSANRLFITGGGNVGIGTDNANSKLEVNGSLSLPIRTITVSNSFTQILPITDNDYTIFVEANFFNGVLELTLPEPQGRKGRIYHIATNELGSLIQGTPIIRIKHNQTVIQNLFRNSFSGTNVTGREEIKACTIQSTGTKWVVINRDYYYYYDER